MKTRQRMLLQWTTALKSLVDTQRQQRNSFFVFQCMPVAKHNGLADSGPHTDCFDSFSWRLAKHSCLEDVHFHDIRAKAATDAKRDGLNYQSLMGHATEVTSNGYLRGQGTAVVQPPNRRTKK